MHCIIDTYCSMRKHVLTISIPKLLPTMKLKHVINILLWQYNCLLSLNYIYNQMHSIYSVHHNSHGNCTFHWPQWPLTNLGDRPLIIICDHIKISTEIIRNSIVTIFKGMKNCIESTYCSEVPLLFLVESICHEV